METERKRPGDGQLGESGLLLEEAFGIKIAVLISSRVSVAVQNRQTALEGIAKQF